MTPHTIRMHPRDNVAIVANDGGLPAGTVLPEGLTLRDQVPQGHKVALVDVPADTPVWRYGVAIGYALKDIAAGSWVHERLLQMPSARSLDDLPIAIVKPDPLPPLLAGCMATPLARNGRSRHSTCRGMTRRPADERGLQRECRW